MGEQNVGPAFGVLLGVGNGDKALQILQAWPRGVLFLVDPYIHLRRGYDRPENVGDQLQQRMYEQLRFQLQGTPELQGRYSFIREFSFAVPRVWREKAFGQDPAFVFLDANPSYLAVRKDLQAWWPLLAVGGIMAGSNYTTQGDGANVGVRLAVDEFAVQRGVQVYFTDDAEPVWIFIKE